MRILKRIEFGVDIYDPIKMYEDPDYLLNILIQKFEKRCYKSCYIEKILRVIPELTTDCNITCDGAPTFGTVGVICDVSAIVYQPGEVINNCTVVKRSNGVILCTAKLVPCNVDISLETNINEFIVEDNVIADIMIEAHSKLTSIIEGQVISVRVGNVKYTINNKKIAINAIPYLISQQPIVFKINSLNNIQNQLFDDVIKRIKYEETERQIIQSNNLKEWNVFNMLLYAYNVEQKPVANAKEISIYFIANLVATTNDSKIAIKLPNYVSRDPGIIPSRNVMYSYDSVDDLPSNAIIKTITPIEEVQLIMLEDYCTYLRNIREMYRIYSTDEMLLKHKNLWKIFLDNKNKK